MDEQDIYERFQERYSGDDIPWDDVLPPPEVTALAQTLSPGWALDLGCGYGRTSIYLAQQGWRCVGIDFVEAAVAEAQRRAFAASVAERTTFYVHSVADLGFLERPFQLAVDVGCLHALTPAQQVGYRDGLVRLLDVGASYLLFVRLRDETATADEGPRGIAEAAVRTLFSKTFALEKVVRGSTQTAEAAPGWASAWFWYRRR